MPTPLASEDVNGPFLSAAGTRGFVGTEPGSLPGQIRTTLVVNLDHLRPNSCIVKWVGTICARMAESVGSEL
jgi:hypothetical protein